MVEARLTPLLIVALMGCWTDPAPPPAQVAELTVQRLGAALATSSVEEPRLSQDHTLMDGALVSPGRVRRVEIEVPYGQPELRFAITVTEAGNLEARCLDHMPFTIVLDALDGSPREPIFEQRLDRPDHHNDWHWQEVSLDAWQGRRVALQLAVGAIEGGEPACAAFQGAFGDLQLVAGSVPAAPPPNLLLVVVDTLRGDHVGYLEGAPVRTANLSRWSSEGAWFDDALSSSSWTREAVYDLMTGTYLNVGDVKPEAHGVHFPQRVPTIAELLRDRGYRTLALMGNPLLEPPDTSQRGFDVFRAISDAESPAALDELLRGSDPRQPVFVYVHLMGPHLDYCYRDQFSAPHFEGIGQPANPRECLVVGREPAEWTEELRARAVAYYRGEVEFADHIAGQALEHLSAFGSSGSPWLFFTADHGEEFWDHDGYEHGHTMFQELVRVPMLIRPPSTDGWKVGRHTEPVSIVDLAHTIAEIAGLGPLERPAGMSLLPALRGDPPAAERVRLVAGTIYGPARVATVIEGVKTAWDLGYEGKARSSERYDLRADPLEHEPAVSSDVALLHSSAWAAFQDLAVTSKALLRVDARGVEGRPVELALDSPGGLSLVETRGEGLSCVLSGTAGRYLLRCQGTGTASAWLQLRGVQEQHGWLELGLAPELPAELPLGTQRDGALARLPLPWRLYRPAGQLEPLAEDSTLRVSWVFPTGTSSAAAHPDTTERLRALGYIE